METFPALLAICAGNSWGWWFETHSPPLWRHSKYKHTTHYVLQDKVPHGQAHQKINNNWHDYTSACEVIPTDNMMIYKKDIKLMVFYRARLKVKHAVLLCFDLLWFLRSSKGNISDRDSTLWICVLPRTLCWHQETPNPITDSEEGNTGGFGRQGAVT